ncbi:MAG: hypothetical protein K6F23_03620 [Solobacterium sp.]|nr:hypothetical protein [Solobacterium sp.]
MNNVGMVFGRSGAETPASSGMTLVESGYLSGDIGDSKVLDVSVYQIYLLFTREITISSGAIRGFRAIQIARSEDGGFQRQYLASSTNAGVTITNGADSITLKPSSASYDVYYALYAVL